MASKNALSRREFVKDAGGLLLGFSLFDAAIVPRLCAASAQGNALLRVPARLDAWLRIEKDGTVRVFTGKVDIGMGIETAFAQMVAEELDVAVDRVTFVMGDTSMTLDQGGVGGSTSISLGSKPLRTSRRLRAYCSCSLLLAASVRRSRSSRSATASSASKVTP